MELARTNPEYNEAWYSFFMNVELMGLYLKRGVLDVDIFAEFNPWWYIKFWSQYKLVVHGMRERMRSNHMQNMECAMDSILKYIEEHPELAS